MRFLLTPVGSSGDVHPYIAIGRELIARGHDVMLFSAEPHRDAVERSGIEFVATASAAAYRAVTDDPDLWHPSRGYRTVVRSVIPLLEPARQDLAARYIPGRTVLVGHPIAFVTRTFEEQMGAPAATLHLAPSTLRSAYQVPVIPPGVDISGLPRWVKRALWRLIDQALLDRPLVPSLNAWRATLNLPPVHRVFKDWINSPRCVIGLFPEWFAARQPDWPAAFHHAAFPLWDDASGAPLDAELAAFLDAGSPPVVVAPGSANSHAAPFFHAAMHALQRLGRRALFLTGFAEQVPADLPPTILFRRYAAFSSVLPRAAALVHHGGIGSMAQAFAAGVPQLIMPMAFDQPDNAMRAARLGVAQWLAPKRFTPERVTAALDLLLGDSIYKNAALACRDRVRGDIASGRGIRRTCDLLEGLGLPEHTHERAPASRPAEKQVVAR